MLRNSVARRETFRVEREALVSPVMLGGPSSSSCNNPVALDVFNATAIDTAHFRVIETLPCFEAGRLGTPQMVNLDRGMLPSGEALSPFASILHFMGGRLQPFMDFAVGANAEVAAQF